jgi:hypothetical protein
VGRIADRARAAARPVGAGAATDAVNGQCILVRHGLVAGRARRRKASDYVRWQRPAAMQLWQLDIVYGPRLVDTGTGEVRDGRIVTGLDDHSRYCVLAQVVERATGRAVCLAFAEALARYGAPEEVLTRLSRRA